MCVIKYCAYPLMPVPLLALNRYSFFNHTVPSDYLQDLRYLYSWTYCLLLLSLEMVSRYLPLNCMMEPVGKSLESVDKAFYAIES